MNALIDEGEAGVRRAYSDAKLGQLAELKRRYDRTTSSTSSNNIRPPDCRRFGLDPMELGKVLRAQGSKRVRIQDR